MLPVFARQVQDSFLSSIDRRTVTERLDTGGSYMAPKVRASMAWEREEAVGWYVT